MTKTDHVGTATKYGIPDISKDDLFTFHEAHFSQIAVASFGGTFLNSQSEQHPSDGMDHDEWEEEDDLGYYEDGVKRTLTDEQIEIFRHSELEALRKKQEKHANTKNSSSDDATDLSDGRATQVCLVNTDSNIAPAVRNTKKKKKSTKRGRPEPKPDLRKRTWDVVEKGLDTLDYD